MSLSARQLERYQRQLVLAEVGQEGQRKLAEARVLVVGAGGLGSAAALYLAAAGVGTLGLVDGEEVELSNLQRQILYRTSDTGQGKVRLAAERLAALNEDVRVEQYPLRLDGAAAQGLVREFDVIVGAVDNVATRHALNEACVRAGKPLVEAGVMRFEGLLTVIKPGVGPCYRCIFPDSPAEGTLPTTREAGVMGSVAGTLGLLETTETLKLILGIGAPLIGRLLLYDGLAGSFREVVVDRRPSCPVCRGIEDKRGDRQ